MKQKKRFGLIIAAFLVSATMLTGCATFDNFNDGLLSSREEEKDVVKIGVFEPLSGKDKAYGELEKRGIELAHELYPEVLGRKVELVYGDNQSELSTAEAVAKQLVDKQVSVVIGSYGSALSLAGTDCFTEAKIPMIAVTATNPLVTSSSAFVFRVCFVESFQGVALAKYAAEEMGFRKAAVFRDEKDDFALAVSQAFSDKFAVLTEDEQAVPEVIAYSPGIADVRQDLEKVRDAGAQAILIVGQNADALNIIRQAKEMNLEVLFLGTNRWEEEDFIKEGGSVAEGTVFAASFDPESSITETTDQFLAAYRAKYGQDAVPESSVALGFDAYLVAIHAMTEAGTTQKADLIKAQLMETRDFPGAAGKISFDENGDPIKSVTVKTITDGKFVHIYTMEPVWH